MKIKLLTKNKWLEDVLPKSESPKDFSDPLLSSYPAGNSEEGRHHSRKAFVVSVSPDCPEPCCFTRGKSEELPQFTGLRFQDDAQMMSFLETLITKGNSLREEYCPDRPGPLPDGGSAELPDYRLFEETDPEGRPCACWTVDLDWSDGPKKEQVSLTLSSVLLRRLREEAKSNGMSLSALIDSKLTISVTSPTDKLARQVEGLLTELQRLCDQGRSNYNSIKDKR